MTLRAALRDHWPEYLIEAWSLAMFMISAGVFTTLLEAPASPVRALIPDPDFRRALNGLAMGLTAIGIIYSPWGRRSGAHLNPSVTLTFLRLGKMAPWDGLFYILAQFAGGLLGVLAATAALGEHFTEPPVAYVATRPGPSGVWTAMTAEFLIAAGLMLTVLCVANSRRHAPYAGLCAGALVALYIAFEAPYSGMSMNPARTFASAAIGGRWEHAWIYFVAPVLGMQAAAFLHRLIRPRQTVRCAKLDHPDHVRCIHCGYEPPESASCARKQTHFPRLGPLPGGWTATIAGSLRRAIRFSERSLGPFAELSIRLFLAQMFFVSGVLKASDFDHAVYLATYEYPLPWLEPVTAAFLGVAVELGGAALLAAGLATRLAAAALLALSLVAQLDYAALDANRFEMALFGWYVVRGAGPWSLDRALSHGLGDSAVPFAAPALRLSAWLTRWCGPVYPLAFRLWVAVSLGSAALARGGSSDAGIAGYAGVLSAWLPLKAAGVFPPGLAVTCAALLALGLATRGVGLILFLSILGEPMTDPALADDGYWLAVFGLFVAFGPGALSADALLDAGLRQLFPRFEGKAGFPLDGLPRVVIVGAGFGGLACASALREARVAVTLIDRRNYHLFQPLLYQVATAGLSPGDIATPIRGLFREDFNVRVLLGEVTGIDAARREVVLGDQRLPYDFLVLATGASHSYFGRDEWAAYAPGLKRIEDAAEVRRRLLLAFERAESAENSAERAALLTFLVVGGGPTGVELAGAIAELSRFGMAQEFRRFDPASARIVLIDANPRVLSAFPEALSDQARRALQKLGVEIVTQSRVERIDAEGVLIHGQRIAARTVFWAAGVAASPAARWLGAEADRAGRLKVAADLSVPGFTGVFAIGDTAASEAWNGQPVPGLAPAAKQGGAYVARLIAARIAGREPPGPFVYRHLGSLATIGRKAAVADFGWLRLSGAPAWWLWGAVHIAFLVGLRNRVSVMLDWFWAYLTFRGGTRLITGGEANEPAQDSLSAK